MLGLGLGLCENFHHSCRACRCDATTSCTVLRVLCIARLHCMRTACAPHAHVPCAAFVLVHCSDGSSVELKPGIEDDERANPHQFIPAVIKPILTMVQHRHEATSVAVSSVSWAAGMARASGRPVVDVGSSKCALLLPTGGKFMHVKAPSLTEPLVAVKAKDYGISPDEVDLARAQYERIVPFLVRCWVEGSPNPSPNPNPNPTPKL